MLIYPEAWGKASQPMTEAEFEGLKWEVVRVVSEVPAINRESIRCGPLCQHAPFVRRAIEELEAEGLIVAFDNTRLYTQAHYSAIERKNARKEGESASQNS